MAGSFQNVDLLDGEKINEQQRARYGDESFRVGGQLLLTNKRLIFRPVKNRIGPSATPIALDLGRITAMGRRRGGWITRLFIFGQNADSWFVEADGQRHWFDLGWGWNKMWVEKFAARLDIPVTEEFGK